MFWTITVQWDGPSFILAPLGEGGEGGLNRRVSPLVSKTITGNKPGVANLSAYVHDGGMIDRE